MIKELPEKLKTLRLQFGLSQKQVAIRLNVSPSIVSGYETGERTPSLENLLALSYLFRVSTDYLLGKRSESKKATVDVSELSDKQIAALCSLVDAIRENGRP